MTQRQPERNHPAAVDFFRVLATFCVGWFHIWQQSWVGGGPLDHWPRSGAVWVDVLVMLSAFCLFLPTANALADGREPPPVAPRRFWRRRAARIVPSYYASLLAALLLAVGQGARQGLAADLLAHLTFTQMFFPQTYTGTRLNGVTWTLTVLAVFYLVFPWLDRALRSRPASVLAALLAVQLGYTLWLQPQYGTGRYALLFNQFPAFCGVLAVGLAGAMAFARLGRCPAAQTQAARVCFTLLGLAALWGIDALLRRQAAAADYQLFQLQNRMPLALAACTSMVCLALGVRFPLGRVWRLLAGISYNFYLWHQLLAVALKYQLRLPAWAGETPPNQLGDTAWMARYNALAWAAALAAAAAATLLLERPAARRLARRPARSGGRGR